MKRALLVMLVAAMVLPVASARASDLCTAAGSATSSALCSLAPSAAYLPGQAYSSPLFTFGGEGWMLLPIARANPLNFGATFPGSLSRVTGSAEPMQLRMSSQAGRQLDGEGGGGISGGVGVSLNGAPDGWFKGSPGDGGGRFRRPWNPNFTGFVVSNGSGPLAETPEPLTLALFGTGLLLIGLIARRRFSGERGEP